LYRRVETLLRRSTNRSGRAVRREAGLPQCFTRVDVPETGDAALIEEKDFYGSPSPGQQRGESFDRELLGERFHTNFGSPRFFRFHQAHPAELADIREAKPGTVGKADKHFGVRLGFEGSERLNDEAAGHTKVRNERAARSQRDHHVFAAPAHGGDAFAAQFALETRGFGGNGFRECHRCGIDYFIGDRAGQAARDGFDFGEFGHGGVG